LNEPDEEPLTSTFVEDETAGGSFHEKSPPMSHEATPSAGQPSGVVEDPLTLTALSYLLSKTIQHAERVAKSPTQVSSRSVKTYTRASKGSVGSDMYIFYTRFIRVYVLSY
ncbi:hypothetical protein Tco_1171341, partial [Tanacetum coccineum]